MSETTCSVVCRLLSAKWTVQAKRHSAIFGHIAYLPAYKELAARSTYHCVIISHGWTRHAGPVNPAVYGSTYGGIEMYINIFIFLNIIIIII